MVVGELWWCGYVVVVVVVWVVVVVGILLVGGTARVQAQGVCCVVALVCVALLRLRKRKQYLWKGCLDPLMFEQLSDHRPKHVFAVGGVPPQPRHP